MPGITYCICLVSIPTAQQNTDSGLSGVVPSDTVHEPLSKVSYVLVMCLWHWKLYVAWHISTWYRKQSMKSPEQPMVDLDTTAAHTSTHHHCVEMRVSRYPRLQPKVWNITPLWWEPHVWPRWECSAQLVSIRRKERPPTILTLQSHASLSSSNACLYCIVSIEQWVLGWSAGSMCLVSGMRKTSPEQEEQPGVEPLTPCVVPGWFEQTFSWPGGAEKTWTQPLRVLVRERMTEAGTSGGRAGFGVGWSDGGGAGQ